MAFNRWVDASVQKEVTNQKTNALIDSDERTSFMFGLPATALLNLENKLAALRSVAAVVPTLDPVERWEWSKEQGCYLSAPRFQDKTTKVPKSFVTYEATPEHPAQVTVYHEDVRVGVWETTIHSGMYTPRQKRELLGRIDDLLRAVKQARQRANDVEANADNYSDALMEYLFDNL